MRKILLGSLLALCLGTPAQADAIHFTCQRFKSNCVGKACLAMAEGFKADTEHKILTLRPVEKLDYKIDEKRAVEIIRSAQDAAKAALNVSVPYEFVTLSSNLITLERKAADEQVRERVVIEIASGFYAYYAIHNDGSIKDVPLGEPYAANFGWCNQTSAQGANPAAPAAPPAAIPDVIAPPIQKQ